jgi:tartrate dehydrogenase/decarboxylase/D-malate dehydrogenase
MSGALMLDFLGNGDERYRAAHDGILKAIEEVIAQGPITPDLGGKGTTQDVGAAIAQRLV